nr:uncharacterized protein LOC109746719 [Aegilops tauschii subsp. strangulata]
MDVDLWENPDTTIDASFCGTVTGPEIKCKLHQFRGNKYVAFNGINTGRRFYGCARQGGIDCGVIQWANGPWLVILQSCLTKLDMVDDVGKLFDWQDGKVQHMEHQNATHHAEDVKTKLTVLEEQCKMELKMEKTKLT